MKHHSKVVVQNKDLLGGVPVFAGTRVPVHALIDHLKAGSFLADSPSATRAQAVAFLDLAEAAAVEELRAVA